MHGEMSPPMAFRNSVKATLLLEPEQPRSRSEEPAPIFKPQPAPPPSVAQRPSDNVAQRVWKNVVPRKPEDGFLAATWHARAEELCAMADTLPSKNSWSLISKIAALYDEIARDAGWSEDEVLPAPDPGAAVEAPEALAAEETEIAEPVAAEEAELSAPPAEPPATRAFPRRPLAFGRPVARRRA